MVRYTIIFFLTWALVAIGITHVRTMSGKELWSAAKLLTFSLFCAIIAFVILSVIVILF